MAAHAETDIGPLVVQAAAHHRAGRYAQACAAYRQALAEAPERADLHHLLGQALHADSDTDGAIQHVARALELDSRLAGAHYNLGALLRGAGRAVEAEQAYCVGLAARPDDPDLLFARAHLCHAQGRAPVAAELYRRLLDIQPEHDAARINLGACLNDLGRPAEAVAQLEQAIADCPEDAEALNNLGNALQRLGRTGDARERFAQAAALKPRDPVIRANLGRAELRLGRYGAAVAGMEAALGLVPDDLCLKLLNALALPVIPASDAALASARARLEAGLYRLTGRLEPIGLERIVTAPTNFHTAYHGLDDTSIQRRLADIYAAACPALRFTAAHCGAHRPRRGGRLRIGFASAHFGSHTIGKLNRGIIAGLNRSRFDVYMFHLGAPHSEDQDIAEHVVALPPDLAACRAALSEAELDILVYPDIGMEPLTYFLGFARLAPVQCVSVGHPVTTGLPEIDYFLSSVTIEPSDAEAHYTERLVALPTINICYTPPAVPTEPLSRAELGVDEDAHLYLCPQSLFKFHPMFDAMLGGILRGDRHGTVVLIDGQEPAWSELLSARFARTIGDVTSRIRFVPRSDGAAFLRLLGAADVILDTPHFCGGNTSYEAFACGKAIVTLPGRFMRGRVTLGMYRQMGIDDLIARDEQDYVRIATEVAGNPRHRAEAERRIAASSGMIFNDSRVIAAHDDFFSTAVRNL